MQLKEKIIYILLLSTGLIINSYAVDFTHDPLGPPKPDSTHDLLKVEPEQKGHCNQWHSVHCDFLSTQINAETGDPYTRGDQRQCRRCQRLMKSS